MIKTPYMRNQKVSKMNKIVSWLKEKQDELQEEYKTKLSNPNGYDFRGIHLSVTCGCAHSESTPYWINPNGKCKKCGKKITTFQKVKDDALVANSETKSKEGNGRGKWAS